MWGSIKKNLLWFGITSLGFWGCALTSTRPTSLPSSVEPQGESLEKALEALNIQFQTLDNKMNVLLEKIDRHTPKEPLPWVRALPPAPEGSNSSSNSSWMKDPSTASEVLQSWRQAMLFFQSEQYPEAILAFSAWVERFPNHSWAGSAQFYLAESYFKQKDYIHAEGAFRKVLRSYEKSIHITDALRDLAETEDALKRPKDAVKYRQWLTSLFPQSPAAGALLEHPSFSTANTGQPAAPESGSDLLALPSTPEDGVNGLSESSVSIPDATPSLVGGLDRPPETALLDESDVEPVVKGP